MQKRLLEEQPPSKAVAYVFMAIVTLALGFFVYNWWRCRQSRVIDQEMEDYAHDYGDESGVNKPEKDFQPARPRKPASREI